jgi:hypothetical protein
VYIFENSFKLDDVLNVRDISIPYRSHSLQSEG